MHALDRTAWEILNATADDWENLEQIYLLLSLEPSSKTALQAIADGVRELVADGMLAARLPGSEPITPNQSDLSYVWRAWFTMTPEGRIAWEESEHAALV